MQDQQMSKKERDAGLQVNNVIVGMGIGTVYRKGVAFTKKDSEQVIKTCTK